jgi:catechol 2,3-dioxygenase-like lactoylglutathione lyase family enzyme
MPPADPPLVIAVATKDLAKSVEFYRGALDCRVHFDEAPEFVLVKIGRETALRLNAAKPDEAVPPTPRIQIVVPNVGLREKELVAKGLRVHARSAAGAPRQWFCVLDPDGREVAIQGP